MVLVDSVHLFRIQGDAVPMEEGWLTRRCTGTNSRDSQRPAACNLRSGALVLCDEAQGARIVRRWGRLSKNLAQGIRDRPWSQIGLRCSLYRYGGGGEI